MLGNSGITGSFKGLPYMDWKVATKSVTFVVGTTGAVATPDYFAVTGNVIIRTPVTWIHTTLTDAGDAATWGLGTTNNATAFWAAQDTDNMVAGSLVTQNAGIVADVINATVDYYFLHEDANIMATIAGEAITGGVIDVVIEWAALSSGASIVPT